MNLNKTLVKSSRLVRSVCLFFFFIVRSPDSVCGNPSLSIQILILDIFQASFWSRCHFSAPFVQLLWRSEPRWLTAVFLCLQRTKTAGVRLSALEDGPKIGCLAQGWLTVEAPLNYPATVEGWEERWLITACQESGKRGIFSIRVGPSGRWLGLVRDRWSRGGDAENSRSDWEMRDWGFQQALHERGLMRGKLLFVLHEQTKLRQREEGFAAELCQ